MPEERSRGDAAKLGKGEEVKNGALWVNDFASRTPYQGQEYY